LTVGQICLLVPFDAEVTATILGQLAKVGALEIPGAEIPEPLPALKPATPVVAPVAAARPAATAGHTTMMEGLELTVEQARRIDDFYASLATRDAFELLEIARTADKKEVKRAYFKMSKELHPDRYFGKNIGPYKDRLSKIFQSVKAAYELLSDDARRTAYLESVK
ncbi:MAG TPA: J domain-containing protein, partial [Polyangia bacterium]